MQHILTTENKRTQNSQIQQLLRRKPVTACHSKDCGSQDSVKPSLGPAFSLFAPTLWLVHTSFHVGIRDSILMSASSRTSYKPHKSVDTLAADYRSQQDLSLTGTFFRSIHDTTASKFQITLEVSFLNCDETEFFEFVVGMVSDISSQVSSSIASRTQLTCHSFTTKKDADTRRKSKVHDSFHVHGLNTRQL